MSVDDSMRRTIAEQHDEIGTLKAENAKLREDLEFERSENGWAREFLNCLGPKCGTKDCPSLVAYVTKLEDENAKLRELVRNMFYAVHPIDREKFLINVAELWIEVDG